MIALFFRCFVFGQSNKNTSVKVEYPSQKLLLCNKIWQNLVFDTFSPIPAIKTFLAFLQAEKICISLLDRPRTIYVKNRAIDIQSKAKMAPSSACSHSLAFTEACKKEKEDNARCHFCLGLEALVIINFLKDVLLQSNESGFVVFFKVNLHFLIGYN